jgi:hypothetical protein
LEAPAQAVRRKAATIEVECASLISVLELRSGTHISFD